MTEFKEVGQKRSSRGGRGWIRWINVHRDSARTHRHASPSLLPVADIAELKINTSIQPRVDLKHCVDRLLGRPAHAHTYQLQLAADKKTI